MSNADGSSSKLPRSITVRRKSYDALKRAAEASNGSTLPSGNVTGQGGKVETSVASTRKSNSVMSDGGEGSRRVKTVPPSAVFEPPTPPTPAEDVADNVSAIHQITASRDHPPATSASRTRRRRQRIRYDSSESSADNTDADSSEEEPPWWTFTQRGMAKMRARATHRRERTERSSALSGAESGKDNAAEGSRRPRIGSRQNSRDKKTTPASSIRKGRRGHGAGLAAAVDLKPRSREHTLPNASTLLWRRSQGREVSLAPITLDVAPPMIRSSSDPTSPGRMPDGPSPISPDLTTVAGSVDEARHSDPLVLTKTERHASSRRPIPPAKRQLTAPNFPRFLRRGEQDVHTDSETAGATLPRAKLRETLARGEGGSLPPPQLASRQSADDEHSIPNRHRMRRLQTHRLKINLPDPITQHFAEGWQKGWPHAGSWQDAYYGYYSEHHSDSTSAPAGKPTSLTSRRNTETENNAAEGKPRRSFNLGEDRRTRTPEQPTSSGPDSPRVPPPGSATRKKPRRAKRSWHAMAPPTPSGLGFTPHDLRSEHDGWKGGHVGAGTNGFQWEVAPSNRNRETGRIDEGDELTRADTHMTNEKTNAGSQREKRWWMFGRKQRQMMQNGRYEKISWNKKMRRMLFLDARVTIYIRLVNLAVVIVSLALAVRIRLQLDELQVPGLLGSSTTLLIAYSSLTMFHVLIAIYREYFGKPIGLWGLRSKMLWVCLDLAFIALWSSSVSAAINDHISTPLQCTAATPWWRGGLASSYAELLESLQLAKSAGGIGAAINGNSTLHLNSTVIAGTTYTPVEMITHSLGIILPTEITGSKLAHLICDKQIGSIALALLTLLLYTGNMVLSLFRIFETVRRTANVDRAVMV